MIILTVFMIVGACLLRLVPHIPNVAPVSAMALFGGVYLDRKWSLLVPLFAMIISDYLLLYVHPYSSPMVSFDRVYPISALFHSTTIYVWGSFAISGLIGLWLRKRNIASNVILASLFSSVQFFIITNFGVWASGMYSRDISGLVESYVMGIPFFRWTLYGDIFYTLVFFGSYALAMRMTSAKKLAAM